MSHRILPTLSRDQDTELLVSFHLQARGIEEPLMSSTLNFSVSMEKSSKALKKDQRHYMYGLMYWDKIRVSYMEFLSKWSQERICLQAQGQNLYWYCFYQGRFLLQQGQAKTWWILWHSLWTDSRDEIETKPASETAKRKSSNQSQPLRMWIRPHKRADH